MSSVRLRAAGIRHSGLAWRRYGFRPSRIDPRTASPRWTGGPVLKIAPAGARRERPGRVSSRSGASKTDRHCSTVQAVQRSTFAERTRRRSSANAGEGEADQFGIRGSRTRRAGCHGERVACAKLKTAVVRAASRTPVTLSSFTRTFEALVMRFAHRTSADSSNGSGTLRTDRTVGDRGRPAALLMSPRGSCLNGRRRVSSAGPRGTSEVPCSIRTTPGGRSKSAIITRRLDVPIAAIEVGARIGDRRNFPCADRRKDFAGPSLRAGSNRESSRRFDVPEARVQVGKRTADRCRAEQRPPSHDSATRSRHRPRRGTKESFCQIFLNSTTDSTLTS